MNRATFIQGLELISGKYHATVAIESMSADTAKIIASVGEPDVEVGGDIAQGVYNNGELSNDAFTLPTAQRRFTSGFPYTAIFDTRDLGDVQAPLQAQAWLLTMKDRFETTLDTAATAYANQLNLTGTSKYTL